MARPNNQFENAARPASRLRLGGLGADAWRVTISVLYDCGLRRIDRSIT